MRLQFWKKPTLKERIVKTLLDIYKKKDGIEVVFVREGEFFVYRTQWGYDKERFYKQDYFEEKDDDEFIILSGQPISVDPKFEPQAHSSATDEANKAMQELKKIAENWKPYIDVVVPFPKDRLQELYRLDDINEKECTYTSCYNLWQFIEEVVPEIVGIDDVDLIDDENIMKPVIKYKRKALLNEVAKFNDGKVEDLIGDITKK